MAAFTGGSGNAVTGGGAYRILWLEEGEGGQLRTKGLGGRVL
jgi:hypothetical protein